MTQHNRERFRSLHTRRGVAKGALGLGLGVPAASVLARNGLAHQASTPTASPAAVDQLDLANLSPGVADPSEPVTITFASWHTAGSDVFEALRTQFQELHPNITVDFEEVPAEEFTDRLTTLIAPGTLAVR